MGARGPLFEKIERGDHILLGISGGADSVCLARYFLAKRESLALNLYAVHVNHMLRGDEAKRDEEFVREFCRQWNIPLHVEYRDIKKESREKKCSEEEQGDLPDMSVLQTMPGSISAVR